MHNLFTFFGTMKGIKTFNSIVNMQNLKERPSLTEPGVMKYLQYALQESHVIRDQFYNTIFNVSIFIFFIVIVTGVLLYKYKGRLSKEEIAQKNRKKQQYILEKLKKYQIEQQRARDELITGLPHWERPY